MTTLFIVSPASTGGVEDALMRASITLSAAGFTLENENSQIANEYRVACEAAIERADGVATMSGWCHDRDAVELVRYARILDKPVGTVSSWIEEYEGEDG